ncbi:MAG TPA: choice-of-anchor D domain-containing protein [Candidatus Kapabacteria bacterium]|nr:choice-of-anchor D domain-containing protein [Candidatus Kapabacteria bacterium]
MLEYKYIILFLLGLLYGNSFANERLIMFNQTSDDFPIIQYKSYYYNNGAGTSLNKQNINLFENSSPISDFNITKTPDSLANKSLFVFALDLSASVTKQKIQNYQSFIQRFIANLPLTNDRFAVVAFNNSVYNILPPSTAVDKIENIFNKLQVFGNSNYDSLFLSSFNVLSYHNYSDENYNIIVLNDGSGLLSEDLVKQQIIKKGAKVYSVSFDSENIQALKSISSALNCLSVSKVSNNETIDYYADLINLHSRGYRPSVVSYRSRTCSSINEVDMAYNNSLKDKKKVYINPVKFPHLEFLESNGYDFGVVQVPNFKIVKFKIKVINDDILVQKIIDNNIFRISGISQNQILKKNEIYEVQVRYLPQDTNYIYNKLEILHNACFNTEIFVSGGRLNKSELPKDLQLLQANGGERINANDSYTIKWSGVLPQDTVSLEYSIDNGINWNTITNKASTLSYNWNTIPKVNTDIALIKVKSYSKSNESVQIKSLKGINGSVVGLKWGNKPNQLYTGSRDGFIRLWDTEKVEPLKTIINGITNLNMFDLSNDEKYIAVVADNRLSVQIYDVQTSFLINTYSFQSEINNLDWDNNSYNFAVATLDDSLFVFEYPNLEPFSRIKISNSITTMKISPFGNKIAIGTKEGYIIIINTNGEILNQFKNSDVGINDLSWNKSNNILSVCTNLEIVNIWDVSSSINVLQITEQHKPVVKVSWSPNLKFISTINANKSINLWKPEDGSLFYTFNFHTSSPNTLEWNRDGSVIASGTDGGEVLIWSINDIPFERSLLQEDQSNATFSIVLPTIHKSDIFMGQHTIGNSFDTTITNYISNIGNIDITVDSIKVWGDTQDRFQILSHFPMLLSKGGLLDLKVSFLPNNEQNYIDTILIYSGNSFYRSLIQASGIKQKISVTPINYNFGNIKIGEQSIQQKFIIENLTASSIEIEDYIINEINGFQSSTFLPTPLQAFEKRELAFTFSPQTINEASSVNYFKFADINDKYYILLNGRGIAPSIQIPNSIELPNLICEGDTSQYDLYIKNIGNNTLIIDTIYINSTNKSFFIDASTLNKNIQAMDSALVRIYFYSQSSGFSTSNLIIKSNINANGQDEFNISLISQKVTHKIRLQSTEVSVFAEMNQSKNTFARIYNDGDIPIKINTNFNNQYFKILDKPQIIIVPEDSVDITVQLNPMPEAGVYSSLLSFKDTCGKQYNVKFDAYVGIKSAKISLPESLNFDTLICNSVSNPKGIIISNIGDSPLIIDKIEFINDGSDNFDISKNISKNILQKGEKDTILILVNSSEIGQLQSELRIFSNAENTTNGYNAIKLSSFVSISAIKFDEDTLFFNDIFENMTYHKTIRVTNIGNTDVKWSYPIKFENFEIDSIIPAISKPNEQSIIYVSFSQGKFKQSYTLDYYTKNTCNVQQKLVLYANVTKNASLGIKAGIIHAVPGDTIQLPIYLYLKESNEFPLVDYYECELQFNATLLIPIDTASQVDNSLNRIVKIKLNALPNNEGVIGNIRFKSFLGNSDSTTIQIINSKAIGRSDISIEEINGMFYLDSVCYAGGARLIGSTGVLRLSQNYPNPLINVTTIPFSLIELGRYSIDIFDINSNILENIDLGTLNPGKYEIKIDLSKYSSGNYFYRLNTPSSSLTKKMTIHR